jgi:hypothetical protein
MPPIITHFLLSPSIISHLQLLLIFPSMREIPHQSSFVGVDSLEKTRFRFYCIDIYHFKICLPSPPVINHFLLSPSTISYLPVLLIFLSMREIKHQSPLLPLPTSVHHPIFLSCLLPQTLHLILASLS